MVLKLVELDCDLYELPVWRFRFRPGTSKQLKRLIPVSQTYGNLVNVLSENPAPWIEWTDS